MRVCVALFLSGCHCFPSEWIRHHSILLGRCFPERTRNSNALWTFHRMAPTWDLSRQLWKSWYPTPSVHKSEHKAEDRERVDLQARILQGDVWRNAATEVNDGLWIIRHEHHKGSTSQQRGVLSAPWAFSSLYLASFQRFPRDLERNDRTAHASRDTDMLGTKINWHQKYGGRRFEDIQRRETDQPTVGSIQRITCQVSWDACHERGSEATSNASR